MYARFQAGCRIWETYVRAVLAERHNPVAGLEYVVGSPEISEDRLIVSLPIGGTRNLWSRSHFENTASYLLREFLPIDFVRDLEEGLTEPEFNAPDAMTTSWWSPAELIQKMVAGVAPFGPARS